MVEFLELTVLQIILLSGAYFIGGFVKGVLGFGLPVVSIGMTSMVVSVDMALALTVFLIIATNFVQFLGTKDIFGVLNQFKMILYGLVLGVPIGTYLLLSISNQGLLLALGIFVVFYVFTTAITPRLIIPTDKQKTVGGIIGFLAGISGALTTVNGPFFIIYMISVDIDRKTYISGMGLCLMVSGVLLAISYYSIGLMDVSRAMVGMLCIPGALIGMWVGEQVGKLISADKFRMSILIFLFLIGLNLIRRGIMT